MDNKALLNFAYLNCRRGILELDIILIKFIELEFLNLDKIFLDYFFLLLKEDDENLYRWLVLKVKTDKKHFDCIIKKINTVVLNIKF